MPSSQRRNASASSPSIVAASHGPKTSIFLFALPDVNCRMVCESVALSSKQRSQQDSSSFVKLKFEKDTCEEKSMGPDRIYTEEFGDMETNIDANEASGQDNGVYRETEKAR